MARWSRIRRTLVAGVSLGVIASNLLLWVLFLIPLSLLALLPVRVLREFCEMGSDWVYRCAVRVDSFWIEHVLGVAIRIHGPRPRDRRACLLVVANHVTWFDILVLQRVIVDSGPIARFLVKRELIFVPIIGWICLALRFPRLARQGDANSRKTDLATIGRFARERGSAPGAVILFAEGTRFTVEKHRRSSSAYAQLLAPRPGGFSALVAGMPDGTIMDVTLVYPAPEISLWRCLDGTLDAVDVVIEYEEVSAVAEPAAWLGASWQHKDARLVDARRQREGK